MDESTVVIILILGVVIAGCVVGSVGFVADTYKATHSPCPAVSK